MKHVRVIQPTCPPFVEILVRDDDGDEMNLSPPINNKCLEDWFFAHAEKRRG